MKRTRSPAAPGPSKKGASSATTPSATPAMPPGTVCRSALLVMGGCHSVMTGLVLKKEKFYLKFAIKHHVGSVKDVAVSNRWVASCGPDERVFLFTNKSEQRLTPAQLARMRAAGEPMPVRLADLGSLTPPCEVHCLAFTAGSQYLLCGCAEGQLLVYRTRDWALTRTLPVHDERALRGLAVHPGSGGTLVVTVGDDRSVAVLDLARGRLLTKWKYDPARAEAGKEGKGAAVVHTDGDTRAGAATEDAARVEKDSKADGRAAMAANPLDRLFAREAPTRVLFSPAGTHFLVHACFSLVVHATSTMAPVLSLRLPQPLQLDQEIHSVVFLDEDTVLLGDEAARLLSCRVVGPAAGRLVPVRTVYPAALQSEAAARLAGPICVDAEVRQKHPLRHVSRIKALRVAGRSLFSADSNGLVFSWTMSEPAADGTVTLTYVASANCQGRATCIDVLPL